MAFALLSTGNEPVDVAIASTFLRRHSQSIISATIQCKSLALSLTQMKDFAVISCDPFFLLYKVGLTFESVDEITVFFFQMKATEHPSVFVLQFMML